MFLSKTTVTEAVEYSKLYKAWNNIIDEVFMANQKTDNETARDFVFDDTETRNRVNAIKLHDHSKVKELEHQRLVIEADHPGWIQILQYKQRQLLTMVRNKFPSLDIQKINFVLMKDGNVK
jgi:hypothetical protein